MIDRDLSKVLVDLPEYPLGKNLNLASEKLWLSVSAEGQSLMIFFYVEDDLAMRELNSPFEDINIFHDRARGNRVVVKLERPELAEQFAYVMHEIAAGMDSTAAHANLDFFMLEIEKWSSFLAPKREGISDSELFGFWGELHVLCFHVVDRLEPIAAIDSYVALEDAPQDLAAKDFTIEVKATTQKSPKRISISSLDQLDAWPARQLLALILISRADTGLSVRDLIVEIEARISSDVRALRKFRLAASKKLESASEIQLNERFSADSEVAWEVAQDFPALRRRETVAGIVDATYEIAIPNLTDFLMDYSIGDWIDAIRVA